MSEDGVEQGMAGVTGCGVNDKACRLVNYQKVIIFVDYAEGDIFGDKRGGRGWQGNGDLIVDVELEACLYRLVIYSDIVSGSQLLDV